MLPAFEEGALPPGIHEASWSEVVSRFGWNERRQSLLEGLRRILDELASAGCREVWLDGSFVTEKDYPGDFDLVWSTKGVDLTMLDSVVLDVHHPRSAQKSKYGGDILPNVTEAASGMPFLDFFQQDSETGRPRGIVAMTLGNSR